MQDLAPLQSSTMCLYVPLLLVYCADELDKFPAALAPADGFLCSAWIEAMLEPISNLLAKGIPSNGVLMNTKLEGKQRSLFEIIRAMYTGTLLTGQLKDDKFRAAFEQLQKANKQEFRCKRFIKNGCVYVQVEPNRIRSSPEKLLNAKSLERVRLRMHM